MPYVSGMGDFEVDVLYDREKLRNRTRLFTVPLGQNGKDMADTNMVMGGQLPPPRRFLMRSIRLAFFEFGRPVPVLDPVYWNTTFDFYIGSKRFFRFPAYQVADPLVTFCSVVDSFSQQDREKFITCFQNRLFAHGREPYWPSVDGVQLDQGQDFYAEVSGATEGLATREVFVALEGLGMFAVS